MNLDLSGKTALICGASQGIGLACARQLVALGCRVVLLARRELVLKKQVGELEMHYPIQHRYIVADLSDRVTLKAKIEADMKTHGSIDILINNNQGPASGKIENASEEAFTHAFNNHLQVNALLARLLIPNMRKKQYGRIINIASIAVKTPLQNLGVSNTVRWAVTAWAKTLAGEVGEFGITVNTLLPGFTETEALKDVIKHEADARGISVELVADEWKAKIPLKRFAKPEEVGSIVAFLASKVASYVNGVAWVVDGGATDCI